MWFDWLVIGGSITVLAIIAGVFWWAGFRKLPVLTDELPEHRYPSLANREANPQVPPMRNPTEPDPPTTYTRKRKRNRKKAPE